MYAEIVILAMLRQRPQHGYEIKKGIEQVFGGTVALNNTVLYPTLKRFEEAGGAVGRGEGQGGRPQCHLYHPHQHLSDALSPPSGDVSAEPVAPPTGRFERLLA